MVSFSRAPFVVILLASVSMFFTILLEKPSDAAKATEHLYLDHVICRYSPEFTTNCSCKLSFVTRLQKTYTSMCLISKPIDRVFGHTQLYHRFRSGYQVFLIDRIISICSYFKQKSVSKILDIALPNFLDYLSYNESLECPIHGRFDIIRLPINGAFFNNMFLPVGDYFVNLTVFANEKDFVWNGKYYFTIPEGKTIEDDRMGR